MIEGYGLALLGAVLIIAVVIEMLRRRHIRGRFAVVWIAIACITAVLALAPEVLGWAARLAGVQVPLNLLLFIGFLGSLFIQLQLTAESGRLESELRSLAEELAILRVDIRPTDPESVLAVPDVSDDTNLDDEASRSGLKAG